jgi:hypothetical protein
MSTLAIRRATVEDMVILGVDYNKSNLKYQMLNVKVLHPE